MDEAGRAALGRYGEQRAAEHLTAQGMTVVARGSLADHRPVGPAVRLDVVSIPRQRAGALRLALLQDAV